jgi:4-amino-4-deoxychorismate lyase
VTLHALAVTGRGLVDPEAPAVHADDEAFLRGRAAFETVRVYGGRPFRLDDHLARLVDSARRLRLPPVEVDALRELVETALAEAALPDAMVRFYWTPGRESQGRPLGIVLVRDLPPDLEQLRARGLRLISVPVGLEMPGLLGGVKSTSYALNMVAVDEARHRGADDAVFLGTGGVVLEGPTSNMWWRRGRTLFMPSLELGILAGVTRAVLAKLAPDFGYDVREGVFTLDELVSAEEAFTTSSVREVMPVADLDGEGFDAGSAARELQAELRAVATRAGRGP